MALNIDLTKEEGDVSTLITVGYTEADLANTLSATREARDDAEDARDEAQASESSASTSASTATTQAGIATAKATIATTQAGIATTKASEASVSASNASDSEDATAADRIATNADVVLTNADVVLTHADVVLTHADVVLTHADVEDTNADVVLTHADVVLTGLDVDATNADVVTTGNNVTTTNNNVTTTNNNVTTTNNNVTATNADVVSTHADVVLTNADVGTTNTNAATATTQAGIATAQAVIATTQAGIATTQASNASTSASNASTSATNALASENAAELALTTFQGQYTSGTTEPSSPDLGDLWFDETVGVRYMKVYDGTTWNAAGSSVNGTSERNTYTATASQTTFNATYDSGFVDVYLNGLKLADSDFTATNGTTIVLSSGATAGDIVDIVAYGTFEIADTYTQAQADNLLATKEPADATILKQADIGTSVLAPNGDGSQLTGLPAEYTDADANAFDLGVGQTWQNVTSSRSFGVTYTNTTGKPIEVTIGTAIANSSSGIDVFIDGTINILTVSSYTASGTQYSAVSFIVPDGSTYKASLLASGTLRRWHELR